MAWNHKSESDTGDPNLLTPAPFSPTNQEHTPDNLTDRHGNRNSPADSASFPKGGRKKNSRETGVAEFPNALRPTPFRAASGSPPYALTREPDRAYMAHSKCRAARLRVPSMERHHDEYASMFGKRSGSLRRADRSLDHLGEIQIRPFGRILSLETAKIGIPRRRASPKRSRDGLQGERAPEAPICDRLDCRHRFRAAACRRRHAVTRSPGAGERGDHPTRLHDSRGMSATDPTQIGASRNQAGPKVVDEPSRARPQRRRRLHKGSNEHPLHEPRSVRAQTEVHSSRSWSVRLRCQHTLTPHAVLAYFRSSRRFTRYTTSTLRYTSGGEFSSAHLPSWCISRSERRRRLANLTTGQRPTLHHYCSRRYPQHRIAWSLLGMAAQRYGP